MNSESQDASDKDTSEENKTDKTKVKETRFSEEEEAELLKRIEKKLKIPQDPKTTPQPPAQPVKPTETKEYQELAAKYEDLVAIHRYNILSQFPKAVQTKYKNASMEQLQVLQDMLPTLKAQALDRGSPSEKESKSKGVIGGKVKGKWVT